MTKAKPNLHEINDAIRDLVANHVDIETGEIFCLAAQDQLEELSFTREAKILGCGMAIREHRESSDALAERINNLQVRKKRHEREIAFLKGWVEGVCDLKERFSNDDIELSFRSSKSYDFREGAGVDDTLVAMLTFKPAPPPVLSKKAVADYVKEHGEEPPGIEATSKRNLQIG